jgi:hypothetical protein
VGEGGDFFGYWCSQFVPYGSQHVPNLRLKIFDVLLTKNTHSKLQKKHEVIVLYRIMNGITQLASFIDNMVSYIFKFQQTFLTKQKGIAVVAN